MTYEMFVILRFSILLLKGTFLDMDVYVRLALTGVGYAYIT